MKPFQTILNAFKIKSQQILALLFAAVFTIIHSFNHNVNCKWVPSYCHCGVIWKKTRVMCGEAQVSLLLTRVQQIQSHKQWKNKSSCFRGCITINQENLRSLIRSHIPQTCLCYRQWVNSTLTSCNSNSALIIFLCQSKRKSKSEQLSPDPLLPHLPSLCSLFFWLLRLFFLLFLTPAHSPSSSSSSSSFLPRFLPVALWLMRAGDGEVFFRWSLKAVRRPSSSTCSSGSAGHRQPVQLIGALTLIIFAGELPQVTVQ